MSGKADNIVRMERRLSAAPSAVYAAWTELEQLRGWFGENIEADPRIGGRYRAENRDGGTVFVHSGTYLALEPGKLVRMTFEVPNAPETGRTFHDEFIEVRLAPSGAGTEMTFINGWQGDSLPHEEREAVEAAWSGWLDLLAQHLNRSTGKE